MHWILDGVAKIKIYLIFLSRISYYFLLHIIVADVKMFLL